MSENTLPQSNSSKAPESNDAVARLAGLIILSAQKEILQKVVMSKPLDKAIARSVITVKIIGGCSALQIETIKNDNKAIHKNLRLNNENDFSELATELCAILHNYGQINMFAGGCECQLKCSKSGKATLTGSADIDAALKCKETGKHYAESNNRQKEYILNGTEPFLVLLGISSSSSNRVFDKMQQKFRQINRFLEHIRDIYKYLPQDGDINILDLCCGKSYLSFAVYYYFTSILGRNVKMHGVDLKNDVIAYCREVSEKLHFDNLVFSCEDINNFEFLSHPHLVLSLHACDVATDIVIDKAISLNADVILSTPCCHHDLNHKLDCRTLDFIAKYSMLRQKLCEAATDALRLMRLEMNGYNTVALELIDPDDTPKNILLRGIRKKNYDKNSPKAIALRAEYEETKLFLYGKNS